VLTLDLLSAKLISVHNHTKHNYQANENEKKSKSDQMLLLAKSALSLSYSRRRERRGDKPGVRNIWSRNGVTWSGRELTTKVGNNLGLSLCTMP